ncbi:hypothetical protein HDU67_008219 [Dinochytrium kinnereticum]|nr:hypothetical protein HDU67_008219 [Dinochytrium kinnereticum]
MAKESVWDYPRPPAIEPTSRRLRVELDGIVIAETTSAHRVLETSHPPSTASYYDVKVNDKVVPSRVWYYSQPTPRFAAIKGSLSFYASPFKCFVDGEEVVPQPGDFYGGWMTSDIDGGAKGVKGGPGTWGW